LRSRFWLIIIGLVGVLAVTFLIDQKELQLGKALKTKGASETAIQESIILQACDASQVNYIGPLIPDQNIPNSDGNLSDDDQAEKVPESVWSKRAGFSISTPTDPEYWAQMLGSGWYLDWAVRTPPTVNNLDYWPMIRVHEDCISPSVEEIRRVAPQYPGLIWIIGNEPDVIWQDNINPSMYAESYHALYEVIKSSDPTALIAVGGVSQATPLRLQYLDQVLQTYQTLYHASMPVDWWTVHGYVLREEKGSWGVDIPPGIDATQGELREVVDHGRIDLFEAQIRTFRQWMAERGYQDSPLALTEFGILMPASYGFPPEVVTNYMEQTFVWLSEVQDETSGYPEDGYDLVQKWAWFSISDPTYSTSDLGDLSSGKLTLLGEKFRSMIYAMVP
jgi:hypothetical protein